MKCPLLLSLPLLLFAPMLRADPLPVAADVTLAGLNRAPVRLADLRGKPVVLDFWATWCESCKRALPEHDRTARALGDRVHWFAVDVGEDVTPVTTFLAKHHVQVPVLRDPEGKAAEALGMTEMPYAIVLDAEGRIVARVAGEPYPALRDAVLKLLPNAPGGPREPPPPGGQACVGAQTRAGVAMGTKVQAVVCPNAPGQAGEAAAKAAAEQAFAEFGRLEGLWTTWSPDSEVSRINAAAGKLPVAVSPETFAVLQAAVQGSQASDGLFDITFAPLGEVWRFDTPPGSHEPTKLARVPTDAEVQERLARVGWRHLHLDAAKRTAFLDKANMAIHLGGIGKGAAVDIAVALLAKLGFKDFAVQAGGDLYCGGHNGQRPWRVGIAHPRNKGELIGSLDVHDAAFSTSGDYERFAIIDGRRYHHILDTRTGFPATASQSATVLARNALDAEILTKTAFILGGARGLDYLRGKGAKGVLVDATGKIWQSSDLPVLKP